MTRIQSCLVVVFLLGAGELCCFAEPPAPSRASDSPLELAVLGESSLKLIEIRVEIDGKPVSVIWDETFAKIFAYFDRNADGALDQTEAALLPSALALRQAMGNGFTPPSGAAPPFADLDSDGNGKVSAEELATFYRRAGLGNALIGVGWLPTSMDLTDALLKQLDTDGGGKVSEKEWKAAPDILRKLDKNDDELIGVGELVPKAVYPGAAGSLLLTSPRTDSSLPDVLSKLPLLLLSPDRRRTHWASEIIRRLDRDGDGRLSLTESQLDHATFASLDLNKDGKLSTKEMAAWRNKEPEGRWTIRFGGKPKTAERFEFASNQLRIEGWATEGKLADAVASARRQLTAQFSNPTEADEMEPARGRRVGLGWLIPIADLNGDGKLDRKELDAWLDLQQQIAQGQVLITVLDCGPGLFELLDTNHDGALSIRELRGACDRVKAAGCLTNGAFEREKIPRVLLAAASRGYPQTLGIDMRRGPAWFRAMDKNGDGDVSRKEFTGPPEIFDKLDADKDGLMSAEEAERAELKK